MAATDQQSLLASCVCVCVCVCVCGGCERCSCDTTGSVNGSCDITTGNCYCQPGVGGRRCDHCLPFYFGFARDGCKREISHHGRNFRGRVRGVRVPPLCKVGVRVPPTFKCYREPSFELKLRRNAWAAGLCPRPRWGSLQHSPDPLARFEEDWWEERRGEGRRGEVVPLTFWDKVAALNPTYFLFSFISDFSISLVFFFYVGNL